MSSALMETWCALGSRPQFNPDDNMTTSAGNGISRHAKLETLKVVSGCESDYENVLLHKRFEETS